jgi:two-component system CheB/CheR fusion protein
MHQLNIEHYQDYIAYLEQHDLEASVLTRETLINYTSFFRDRKVWDYLSDQVIPKILAHKAPDERIRVWSAGCATGEEVYSLAMLFAEALGREQFQRRVQLYGTDASLDTINRARRGQYSTEAMQPIPAHLRQKYFEPSSSGYCWRSDLRYPIWFHQRNLIHSPPWPNIDLLVCRHTLMYFTQQAQIRALMRFHFSLRDDGFLLLGRSEALHSRLQKRLFASLDYPMNLYQKIQGGQLAPDLLTIAFRRNADQQLARWHDLS